MLRTLRCVIQHETAIVVKYTENHIVIACYASRKVVTLTHCDFVSRLEVSLQ